MMQSQICSIWVASQRNSTAVCTKQLPSRLCPQKWVLPINVFGLWSSAWEGCIGRVLKPQSHDVSYGTCIFKCCPVLFSASQVSFPGHEALSSLACSRGYKWLFRSVLKEGAAWEPMSLWAPMGASKMRGELWKHGWKLQLSPSAKGLFDYKHHLNKVHYGQNTSLSLRCSS